MIGAGFHTVIVKNIDQVIDLDLLSGHYILTVGDRQIMDNRKIGKAKTLKGPNFSV